MIALRSFLPFFLMVLCTPIFAQIESTFPTAQRWGRKIRYEKILRINDDPLFRVAVKKSEKDGVRDLKNLAAKSKKEEFWTFLPDEDLWIELGLGGGDVTIGDGEDFVAATVATDTEFLQKIFADIPDLKLYHIHPKHLETEAYRLWSQREEKAGRNPLLDDQKWTKAIISANNLLPSQKDLLVLFEFQRAQELWLKNLGIEAFVSVRHYVVSPLGALEYRVKKALGPMPEVEKLARDEYSRAFAEVSESLGLFARAGFSDRPFLEYIDVVDWLKELSSRSRHVELTLIQE